MRPPELASEAVGCDAVHEADRPAGELSYWLVPEARGRGLASAAVRLMMASVVAGTGLRSVVLDIEAGNVASARLAERLGAERRFPTRVEIDRSGVARTLVVYVLPVAATQLWFRRHEMPSSTWRSPRTRCSEPWLRGHIGRYARPPAPQ